MKKLIKATPELLAEMDALQIFGGVGIQGDDHASTAQKNCGCFPTQNGCTYQGGAGFKCFVPKGNVKMTVVS